MISAKEASKRLVKSKQEIYKEFVEKLLTSAETSLDLAIDEGNTSFELVLDFYHKKGVSTVVEKLRDKGYKTCLVEKIDPETDATLSVYLRVVIA